MMSLYEVNRESWKVNGGARGGVGRMGSHCLRQVLAWGEERVLEVDSVQHVISASGMLQLKMVKTVNFMGCVFTYSSLKCFKQCLER